MAILKRLTTKELEQFTYKGWLLLAPIYVSSDLTEPALAVRNWAPEFLLDLSESVFSLMVSMITYFNPHFEPSFTIKITGFISEDKFLGDVILSTLYSSNSMEMQKLIEKIGKLHPGFSSHEIKSTVLELIDDGKVELTHDLFLKIAS